MKPVIIKSFLFLTFLTSVGQVSRYAEKSLDDWPGASGGAAGYGIIAAICIWSFIYFECNYKQPKERENNK